MQPMQPQKRKTWYKKQKERKKNPFFRLLNNSFTFRLLIASAMSFGILAAVHRFEICHNKGFTTECILSDFGAVTNVSNVEAFSIVAAAWMYILESSKRKQQSNQKALEIVMTTQAAGMVHSLIRIEALEMASETGIYFDYLDLQGANLEQIEIPYTRMHHANLSKTVLQEADLRYTDMKEVNLSQANLTKANLTGANLKGANLSGANLTETNLTDVDLSDANLTDVDLSVAHLENTILPNNTEA